MPTKQPSVASFDGCFALKDIMAGTITALEVQKKNQERVNVYIDGAFAFGLNLMDAASLRKGQVLDEAAVTRLQHADAIVRAVDHAVNFLSYRPRSRAEVRKNLAKRDLPPGVVDEAMARLETLDYLNDEAFARFWVENRDMFKPRGPMALRAELREKGVPDAVIEAVVETVDVDDAAYRAAYKRLSRHRGQDRSTFRQKLGAYLGRRGFHYDVIHSTLGRLIEEIEQDDPAYFPGDDDA